MTPAIRKLNLTAHVTSSVGWLGAVAGFLTLCIAGLTNENAQIVRAAYLAMNLIAWFVIVPFAVASLLTGMVQSFGTEWGFFRHYWVVAKLLLTVFATTVLLMKMKLIGQVAGAATEAAFARADLRQARIAILVHASGGLLVLFTTTVLSVYKPWGLTSYGRRRRQEWRKAVVGTPASIPSGLPAANTAAGDNLSLRFRLFLAIAGVIVVVFAVLHLTGGGHGMHHH